MPKARLTLSQFNEITRMGHYYKPALLPDDVQRMPVGQCFDACAINAAMNEKYIYVEGVVKLDGHDDWRMHAWLTDETRRAYDPTWRAAMNDEEVIIRAEYVGVEMDTEPVLDFMRKTEYQGIFANRHRSPALARRAIESRLF